VYTRTARCDRVLSLPVTLSHILCPVDLSEASQHALEQATAIAGWYHATLTVLYVHQSGPAIALEPYGINAAPDEERAEIDRLREAARAVAAPAIEANVQVDVVIDVGDATRQILVRAEPRDVGMIVMGTHGAGGFEHLVLGSVTEKVLRRARCPVLTVPPRVHAAAGLPFRRILCAIDFSDSSLSGLEWAWSLAQESGATVSLLHVIEWPWDEPPAPPFEKLPGVEGRKLAAFRQAAEASSRQQLESLVPDNLRHRCPSTPLVRHGKAHREVLAAAAETRADVIVMGVHGRNVVDLTLFGSTTSQVVRHASCPVLTVRTPR
jgi:nucleotide-binding universal stress UspA family protein